MKMFLLLSFAACTFAGVAEPMTELVPVEWVGYSFQERIRHLRRLHDDYGFRRFVLIGPDERCERIVASTLDGYAKIGESFASARKALADLTDVELGWWMCPTIRTAAAQPEWQRVMNSDGTNAGAMCPLCPKFTAAARARVKEVVKPGGVRIVFFEDDYTLANCGGQTKYKGCFCPLHLAEFARVFGKALSAQEIEMCYAKPTEANRPVREAFARVNRESMSRLAAEIRKAIDSVDPTIRTCLCQPGAADLDGDMTESVARAFAGGTRPMVRVFGASYMNENAPTVLPRCLAHAIWSSQNLPADIETIHETDPYPHTRFYNSSYFLGSEICAALTAGVDGTYYYCSAYTDEPLEDDGYAAWMRANRPRLQAVRNLRATMRPCGVRIAYAPSEVYLRRGDQRLGYSGVLPTASQFLAKMGFPAATVGDCAATVLFEATAEALSDEELRGILSGGVLVEGAAARHLARRGFAELIGCTAEAMPRSVAVHHEEILPVSGCRAAGKRLFTVHSPMTALSGSFENFNGNVILMALPGTEVWSQLVAPDGKPVSPGLTFCRNSLGGRVGVMQVSPTYGYGFNGGTFHFRKQEMLHRLFARLSEGRLDVSAPKTPSTWLLSAKSDSELLVMVENLCGEPRGDVELSFSAQWNGADISRLDESGRWVRVGSVGSSYLVPSEWYYPMRTEFFRLSCKSSQRAGGVDAPDDNCL